MENNDRLNREKPATAQGSAEGDSQRRCILSGDSAPRAGLIRLALGPDGQVAADWSERLPGRGAWITADGALFNSMAGKGRLRGALARAFKGNGFTLADDLGDRIKAGLQQRLLNRLGLEKRSGTLILGGDRVREALAKGKIFAVLHAADARPDGSDRLDGMARAVGESLGETIAHRRVPLSRDALSAALGRDNVVHMGLTDARAAVRVLADLDRLAGFCGDLADNTANETVNSGRIDATEVAANADERH